MDDEMKQMGFAAGDREKEEIIRSYLVFEMKLAAIKTKQWEECAAVFRDSFGEDSPIFRSIIRIFEHNVANVEQLAKIVESMGRRE